MENFKAIVAWGISPLVTTLILQAIAWGLWFAKKRRPAMILLGIGFIVLLIGSLPVFSYAKNRDREFVYAPLAPESELDSDRPVVAFVLGTGFNPDTWLPPNSRVGAGFLARLLEGVRIYHSRSDVRLLVSVANVDADPADKREFLAAMVEMLSLDPERVDLVTSAESTTDEAELVADHRRNGEQVVVVTSAGHMPRAMLTFADLGLDPVAAPTGFNYPRAGTLNDKPWKRWVPSGGGAGGTRAMLYEWLATRARGL